MGATCAGVDHRNQEEVVRKGPIVRDGTAKAVYEEVDTRIYDLECWIRKAEKDAKMWVQKSRTDPMARQRALQCVKQKKQYEQYRDNLLGTQFNMETMHAQTEQAKISLMVVGAMQEGHQDLRHVQQRMGSAEEVEQLQDDLRDLTGEMGHLQEALGRNMSDEADGEVEAEWQRLQEQMLQETNPKHRISAGGEIATLASLPVPDLKVIARDRGVSLQGCTDKHDLVAMLRAAGVPNEGRFVSSGSARDVSPSARPRARMLPERVMAAA